MVSAEGVETTELVPSGAELWRCLKVEAAYIRAHHGQTEQVELIQAIN